MADDHWGPVDKHPEAVRERKQDKPKGRRIAKRIFLVLGLTALVCVLAGMVILFVGYTTTKLPDANADFQTQTTTVYYNDGKTPLGTFAIQNRTPITFAQMPDSIKKSVVDAENRSFWTDKGISFRGMLRAAWAIARGENLQGGSTITQQYIKILYLNSEQTVTRKFREVFLAYKLSKEQTKQQILTGYLNTIYFGHGAYGIQAASKAYFNIDAGKLTVPQAAFLTTVLNNPTLYDPSDDANHLRIMDRYRYVLNSMVEVGDLTQAQADQYGKTLPKFPDVPANERYGGPKGFLLKMVERELGQAGYDSTEINGGGLKIITTFDKNAQDAAVAAAQSYTDQAASASGQNAKNLHAAIASVDVGSGEVIALYGGPDFVKNSRNWATTPRPAASTFKAYALAAGLQDGFSLFSRFRGSTFTPPGDTSTIRNEYGYNYGYSVDLIKATADSINTAFVDMTTQMKDGPAKILDTAEALGVSPGAGWSRTYDRVALGTAEVTPLDQATAYATFANGGVRVATHVVREVRGPKNNVLFKTNPQEKRAISGDIADDVTYALSNVVENGTGRTVQTLNRPVAGKTGTNGVPDPKTGKNIVNSAWFVGYTRQISTAVMYVAGDGGNASLDPYRRPGDSTFFGATYPALTWAKYMETATAGQPVKQFDGPKYVNRDKQPSQAPPSQTPTAKPTQSAPPSEQPTSSPTATASTEPSKEPSGGPSKTPGGKTPGGKTPG